MSLFPHSPGGFFVMGSGRTVRSVANAHYQAASAYYGACAHIVSSICEVLVAPYRVEIARITGRTHAFCRMLEAVVAIGEQATRQVEALSIALATPGLDHKERMSLIWLIGHISEKNALPTNVEVRNLLGS